MANGAALIRDVAGLVRFAIAALLVALAPRAALAHGDETHTAAEPARLFFADPSCPGGSSGQCCCTRSLGSGLQPPVLLSPGWTRLDAGAAGLQCPCARDAVYVRPLHSPLLSRAPPAHP